MKFLHLVIAFLSVTVFAQSYSEDKSEIYTANNEVEDTLNEANNILCIISKIKAEQFVDKGPYKAQIFDERCDTAGARADAQAQAQGGQEQQGAAEVEIASTMIVDAKSAFSELQQRDYIEVRSWFYSEGDHSEAQSSYDWDSEPDMLIYVLTKVWSGATEEDPNGDIEMDFIATSNCQNAPFQTYEEAEAAAKEQGLEDGTRQFWEYTEQYWKCPPIGYNMGNGRLDTTGETTIFMGPRGGNIILTENDNGRDGVYSRTFFECIINNAHVDYQDQLEKNCGETSDLNPNYWSVDISYGFSFDETNDVSCKKIINVTRRQGTNEGPVTSDVTDEWKAIDWNLENNPWLKQGGPATALTETCESTAADDAKLAVWEYGLYTNADDLRYDLKKPGFELQSTEEFPDPYREGDTNSIYAWADYWGTWVGEEWRDVLDDSTSFIKVNSDDAATYNLKQRKMRLTRMSVDNVSLNSLSGIELNLHVEWDIKSVGQECWWNRTDNGGYRWTGEEALVGTKMEPVLRDQLDTNGNQEDDRCDPERWAKLGMPINSTDKNGNQNTVYLGYWDAAADLDGTRPIGKFVFDRIATVVNDRWEGEEDITPFSFTPQQYLEAWDDNLNSSDGYQVWRNLWAHGRGQGYEIKSDALASPDGDFVRRRVEKDITAADLAGVTLGCIHNCLSGGSMKAYFDAALEIIAQGSEDSPGTGVLANPFTSPAILAGDADSVPTGNYVRSGDNKGQWTQEGVLYSNINPNNPVASEVVLYEASGDTLAVVAGQDATQTPLALPEGMYALSDPWSKFGQNICFKAPNGQDECWGMQNHMRLFDVAKFASIECEKTRDTDNDGIGDKYDIHESSEVQSSQSFRLCDSKLWELDDYYEVRWEPWVNYQVFDAAGALVEISRPEAVTLVLPEENKFGRDAGRKKTLEYAGFGRLHGFEWTNFDICQWDDKGEYFDWNNATETERNCIRGFPTYVIPDGTIVMAEDGVTELKSKFLRGEYYLKPLDAASFNNLYTTDPTSLVGLQPEIFDTAVIGDVPEETVMLNGGNTCVDHGEILPACQ